MVKSQNQFVTSIKRLGSFAAAQDSKLVEIFTQGTAQERHRFNLLRRAYIDARYDEDYTITKEELEWLAERVKLLQEMTERICKEKI
ncbi:MAG: hypothetical protein PVH88_18315 [Ignavibacteria bacterium]|jgi:hypothetical protein